MKKVAAAGMGWHEKTSLRETKSETEIVMKWVSHRFGDGFGWMSGLDVRALLQETPTWRFFASSVGFGHRIRSAPDTTMITDNNC